MTIESELRALIAEVVRDVLSEKPEPSTTLVTAREYARRCAISLSTVRLAISERRLAVTRIGRSVRIDPAATIDPPRRDEYTERARARLGVRSADVLDLRSRSKALR